MTTTELPRLNNAQLAEIGTRLRQPMTDEGVRAFYKSDVNALVAEVLAMRRDRAAAMHEFATNPPLEGVDQNTDLAEVASQLSALWVQQQEGLWQKAEVRKLRDRLAAAEQSLATSEIQRRMQAETITTLQSRLASVSDQLAGATHELQAITVRANDRVAVAEAEAARIAAELEETKRAAGRAIASTRADAQRRIDLVNEELQRSRTENQSMREEVSQVITTNQQTYARKADEARRLITEALHHFEN